MYLHEYFYSNHRLYIEFSTKEDGDDFYRILELEYNDIIYYSTDIIDEFDIKNFDDSSVIELVLEYIKENELPEQLTL